MRNNQRLGNLVSKYVLHVFFVFGFLLLPFFTFAPEFELKTGRGNQPVTAIFVGDIMLSRAIGEIMESREDWAFPFRLLDSRIKNADIAFANLENPVSLVGENQGSVYSFRADPKALSGLLFAGFDIVSVANNHMFDWGPDAFLDTIKHLSDVGIRHVGGGANINDARKPAIINRGGMNFHFLAYSQFTSKSVLVDVPSMAPLDLNIMREDISNLGADSSVVVVSIHWGEEYETSPSTLQRKIAYELIDAGADLVIGHHPHVIQEVEVYGNGLIAYSLGNFIFDQNFSEETSRGLILEVVFSDGDILSYKTTEVNFNEKYQPFIP